MAHTVNYTMDTYNTATFISLDNDVTADSLIINETTPNATMTPTTTIPHPEHNSHYLLAVVVAASCVLVMVVLLLICSVLISIRHNSGKRKQPTSRGLTVSRPIISMDPQPQMIEDKPDNDSALAQPAKQCTNVKMSNLRSKSLTRPSLPPPKPPESGNGVKKRIYKPKSRVPEFFRRSRLPAAPLPPGEHESKHSESTTTESASELELEHYDPTPNQVAENCQLEIIVERHQLE